MKATRIYLLLAVFLCSVAASAQRRLVVVDVETLVHVDGANVVGDNFSAQTDTLGCVVVPDSCRSLLFSHINYESRVVKLEEVRDTVFLISKLLNLKEVVVFGKTPHVEDYSRLQKRLGLSTTDLQLAAAKSNGGINLLGLIGSLVPKSWRKDGKETKKERLKNILDKY